MTSFPRPTFADQAKVISDDAGVTIRAANDNRKDSVFEQSASIEARRRVFENREDFAHATQERLDTVSLYSPDSAPLAIKSRVIDVVISAQADEQAPKKVNSSAQKTPADEDWTKTASEIAGRLQNSLGLEKSSAQTTHSYGGVVLRNSSTRRTTPKQSDEQEVPDWIRKAKAFSENASSKAPKDPRQVAKDGEFGSASASLISSPEVIETPLSVEATLTPLKENVEVPTEPAVEVVDAVKTEAPQPTEDSIRSSTNYSEPPEIIDEEEAKQSIREEWKSRADEIAKRFPKYMDEDRKSEIKREAFAALREQHKNSGSLVSQLVKSPSHKAVQANAQQKRSAYKMFAAAPSQVRDTWLPKPDTISSGFEVVAKHHETEEPQVFRSTANIQPTVETKSINNRYALPSEMSGEVAENTSQ